MTKPLCIGVFDWTVVFDLELSMHVIHIPVVMFPQKILLYFVVIHNHETISGSLPSVIFVRYI